MSLLTKTAKDKMVAFQKELDKLNGIENHKYDYWLYVVLDTDYNELFTLDIYSDYGLTDSFTAPTIYQLHHKLEKWLKEEEQKNDTKKND